VSQISADLRPPEPTTAIGFLVFLVRQYGLAALGMVSFVVVVVTIVLALRALGPDMQAMKVIAEKNAETAQAQLVIQSQLKDTITAAKAMSEVSIRAVERMERAADRIEQAAGRK
jgi:hypothetical protein